MAEFAVLRRAQTPAEAAEAPKLAAGLRGALASYQAQYVRQLAVLPRGGPVFIVAGYLSQDPCGPVETERGEILRLLGPGHPSATTPVFCLVQVLRNGDAFSCDLFAAVDAGHSIAPFAVGNTHPVTFEGGLVPDSPASVVLDYAASKPVSSSVIANFFVSKQPPVSPALKRKFKRLIARLGRRHRRPTSAERRELDRLTLQFALDSVPGKVQWLNSSGQVVRSFAAGPPTSLIAGGEFFAKSPA